MLGAARRFSAAVTRSLRADFRDFEPKSRWGLPQYLDKMTTKTPKIASHNVWWLRERFSVVWFGDKVQGVGGGPIL